MSLTKQLTTAFVFVVLSQLAHATNRGFMPGDAFFHSVLTQDTCTRLADSESASLRFVRPKGESIASCGYAGYWALQLPKGSAPLVKNLDSLYADLRRYSWRELSEYTDSEGNTRQVETNGFHIFAYNKDFDPLRHEIALRYNENWVQDESSFGPHPKITRLESFIIDRVAFSKDWRDAADVPPLKTTCPAIPDQEKRMKLGMGNKMIDEPVVATGEVQIILTTSGDFRQYLQRRNGATFYSVTNAGVKKYTVKQREWVVTDWPPMDE